MIPYLKFQQPASDLCKTCEEFKAKLKVAKSDADEYGKVQVQYENHQKAAKLKCQHYNDNINKSKDDFTIAHVCYDWAQNVFIPYSPQQVSSIYFKSAFSVHLFGVCKTEGGQNHQLNFVIGEDNFQKWKKCLHITCDNCSGQNKNNLSLWFGPGWLCLVERNEAILYNNRSNWNWYDFSEFFKKHFVPLPNIKQYYHFRFSSNNIGKVYVSKVSGGEEFCFKLLNNDNFDKNGKPDLIDTTLLMKEQQNYLYSKIHQYVDDPYKDVYCAKPN
ncbi:hypothetical protein C1646_677315 [Rhizophagus diaphanus]|nr:hypothetical protein C1646_677315 [Rhizophagus diaphanus] [Rhizophagus sp. MUCL 43196]